jgi:hypothetical protein
VGKASKFTEEINMPEERYVCECGLEFGGVGAGINHKIASGHKVFVYIGEK